MNTYWNLHDTRCCPCICVHPHVLHVLHDMDNNTVRVNGPTGSCQDPHHAIPYH